MQWRLRAPRNPLSVITCTSDYNEAMNGCLRHLADGIIDEGARIKAIDSIDPSVMTLLSHRYNHEFLHLDHADPRRGSIFV